MPIVPLLTRRIIEKAPFAKDNSYYIMEGRGPKSLRGFGIRVYKARKLYVVRFRGKQPLKNIKRTWKTLCRMAKIENATPYSLRHSFVSEGVPAGVSLELLSDLAGHEDVQITDRVYRSRLDDAQRTAAETMGAHLQELTTGEARVEKEAW